MRKIKYNFELMLLSLRFFISSIVSSIVMFGAFYFWHGIFLNDINRITFSKTLFLLLTACVYIVISIVLYLLFESKFLSDKIQSPIFKGIISGIILGFMLFSFVTVLGISFTKNTSITYIVADFGWQITEQVIGGVIIGLGKLLIFEPSLEHIELNKKVK